jgi:hypothetical protein
VLRIKPSGLSLAQSGCAALELPRHRRDRRRGMLVATGRSGLPHTSLLCSRKSIASSARVAGTFGSLRGVAANAASDWTQKRPGGPL